MMPILGGKEMTFNNLSWNGKRGSSLFGMGELESEISVFPCLFHENIPKNRGYQLHSPGLPSRMRTTLLTTRSSQVSCVVEDFLSKSNPFFLNPSSSHISRLTRRWCIMLRIFLERAVMAFGLPFLGTIS